MAAENYFAAHSRFIIMSNADDSYEFLLLPSAGVTCCRRSTVWLSAIPCSEAERQDLHRIGTSPSNAAAFQLPSPDHPAAGQWAPRTRGGTPLGHQPPHGSAVATALAGASWLLGGRALTRRSATGRPGYLQRRAVVPDRGIGLRTACGFRAAHQPLDPPGVSRRGDPTWLGRDHLRTPCGSFYKITPSDSAQELLLAQCRA